MWSIHTIEYYLTTERKEVLIHAIIWMKLENALDETSQSQRTGTVCHPYGVSNVVIETEGRRW